MEIPTWLMIFLGIILTPMAIIALIVTFGLVWFLYAFIKDSIRQFKKIN